MKKVLLVSLLISFSSCIQKEVKGIKIGHNLYDTQSLTFNKNLCSLIDKTLQKDIPSLKDLIKIQCGGASGCYDLGEVIVQIVCKLGEQDFNDMAIRLDTIERQELKNLIEVGLEYGNENFFGAKNLRTIEKQFPELNKTLVD